MPGLEVASVRTPEGRGHHAAPVGVGGARLADPHRPPALVRDQPEDQPRGERALEGLAACNLAGEAGRRIRGGERAGRPGHDEDGEQEAAGVRPYNLYCFPMTSARQDCQDCRV